MASPRATSQDGSLLGEHRADSISALDALAETELGVKPATAAAPAAAAAGAPPAADDAAKKAADEAAAKAEADRKAQEDAAAAAKAEEDRKAQEAAAAAAAQPDAAAAAAKAEADKKAADEAAKANAQPWDAIQLPPHSSAKAADSFRQLKEAAAAEAKRLKAELDASNATIQDLQTQVKAATAAPKLDPKLEAEVAELRQFKLAHDVEADPSFQEFSGKLKSNDEAIWAKLKASGLFSEESLAKGRQVGTKELDWEKVLPTLSIADRRYIEAKLVDNENIAEQKDAALAAAKANAKTFIETRTAAQADTMKAAAAQVIKGLPSFQRKDIPANASAADKAAIMAHNQAADLVVSKMHESLALGVTPEAVIELSVGTALAYQYQGQVKVLEAEKTALAKQVTDLTAARDAAVKELEAIKQSEAPRNGSAPRYRPPAKKVENVNMSGSDALDALAAEEAARQNG